jgi:predicted  nucleic acid-binding Zn-ribbon protein
MTESAVLEILRAIQTDITGLKTDVAAVKADITGLKTDVAAVKADIRPMRAQLDGLPLINRTVTVIQQEVRSLKAAFNDFALTNPTAGEIEALHSDVNRVQAENAALAVKVATLERLVHELQEQH